VDTILPAWPIDFKMGLAVRLRLGVFNRSEGADVAVFVDLDGRFHSSIAAYGVQAAALHNTENAVHRTTSSRAVKRRSLFMEPLKDFPGKVRINVNWRRIIHDKLNALHFELSIQRTVCLGHAS